MSEYGPIEKDRLEQILSGQPSCSFQLAAHYGEDARLASEFLLNVMHQFPKSIFDDMDGLWNAESLKTHLTSSTNATFYTMSDWE